MLLCLTLGLRGYLLVKASFKISEEFQQFQTDIIVLLLKLKVICLIYVIAMCFSYWSDPDKIDNIEHLRQMEESLSESLSQIRIHKV